MFCICLSIIGSREQSKGDWGSLIFFYFSWCVGAKESIQGNFILILTDQYKGLLAFSDQSSIYILLLFITCVLVYFLCCQTCVHKNYLRTLLIIQMSRPWPQRS